MKLSTLRSFTVVLFIGLLTYGCSGGSSSSGGSSFSTSHINTTLTGNWAGTWKNARLGPGSPNSGIKNEGFIRANLKEDSHGNISGTATWTGFSCFLTATVSGTAFGSGVSLSFVKVDDRGTNNDVRVTFNGHRESETHVAGRWDNDAGCLGEGELTLSRGI